MDGMIILKQIFQKWDGREIDLIEDREQWWAVCNTVMLLLVAYLDYLRYYFR
jgi:hypothetical protein